MLYCQCVPEEAIYGMFCEPGQVGDHCVADSNCADGLACLDGHCGVEEPVPPKRGEGPILTSAISIYEPNVREGFSGVSGYAIFDGYANGIRWYGRITGLKPGFHGVHVHDFGDTRGGCESAGEYFDLFAGTGAGPETYAALEAGGVTADENGVAEFDVLYEGLLICGDNCLIGRHSVIEEGGAHGPRTACGIVGYRPNDGGYID